MSPSTSPEAVRLLRSLMAASVLAAFLAIFSLGAASPVSGLTEAEAEATDDATTDATADGEAEMSEAEIALLQDGATVYSQICSSCHQPGGAGLDGQFPPLIGNPHVDDAEYVADVINNGREGEIVVDGVTYDGVMPSFSTLSDDDVTAVIAYIQNDFIAPSDAGDAEVESTGPVAGTELPALTNMGSLVAFLLAAAVILMVLQPRIVSANSRLDTPWLDVGLKTAVIAFGIIFFTVYVPNWALNRPEVSGLGRFAQDLIGVALWSGGLVIVLGAMWYAHKEDRI